MVRGDNVSVCFTQRYHGSFKVVELQTQNFIIFIVVPVCLI